MGKAAKPSGRSRSWFGDRTNGKSNRLPTAPLAEFLRPLFPDRDCEHESMSPTRKKARHAFAGRRIPVRDRDHPNYKHEWKTLKAHVEKALPRGRGRRPEPEAVTDLLLTTRVALRTSIKQAKAGHPAFSDAAVNAKADMRRRATWRLNTLNRRKADDNAQTEAIVFRQFAALLHEDAIERYNAAWTGLSEPTSKRRVTEEEAFVTLTACQLSEEPFNCSPKTIAKVLVASGFLHGSATAPYPDRAPSVERVIQVLKRSRRKR